MRPDLTDETTQTDLEAAMLGHIIATTELMGTYMRINEAPL